MKKVLLIFLAVFVNLLSFGVYGCNTDDGYELVKSLYFTTSGQTRTVSSTAYPDYEEIGEATETEFNDYKKNKPSYLFISNVFYDGITLDTITVNSYRNLTISDIGATLICYTTQNVPGGTWYYPEKVIFRGWHYQYVYVKIIDSETIAYHFGNEDNTFNFKVTYYRVLKFND